MKPKSGLAIIMSSKPPMGHDDDTPTEEGGPAMIMPPKGFQPPEGTNEGESFTITAKCRMTDGKLEVEAVNGIPLKGEEGETDDQEMKESEGGEEGSEEGSEEGDDQGEQGEVTAAEGGAAPSSAPTNGGEPQSTESASDRMKKNQKAKKAFSKVFH